MNNTCSYLQLAQTILLCSRKSYFLTGQSRVIITIPILDDAVPREPDEYFFVDIIFNTNTVARSVVTITDNDHGKYILM